MKEIGGYFSLEINRNIKNYIHPQGIHLNSGRNALEYILKRIFPIQRIYIPYFTCDVILEPIDKLGIPYSFYHINEELELVDEIHLGNKEYLLVTNYFGIKDAYIKKLATKYGQQLIVDNAQALYTEPIQNIKTIYSPRKFIGIPDGGIAYISDGVDFSVQEQDISYNRCIHLLKRIDIGAEAGYNDFRENSHQLVHQPIKKMSNLTRILLQGTNFDFVKEQRWKNFKQLHKILSSINHLKIPQIETFACPMIYPFYTSDVTLKKRLIENKIFVATYWPNVFKWCNEDTLEYQMVERIIAIPIDQRYGKEDINKIISLINNG